MNDRITALEDALRKISELNETGADENGHRWANSDLIEQEIVFALAAPQPAQPVAATVKPLVWEIVPTGYGPETYEAYAATGFYQVFTDEDSCCGAVFAEFATNRDQFGTTAARGVARVNSFADAKAAAQADYEARIMAALDVQPLTVQDAARVPEIAALIDAVNGLMEVFPDPCRYDHHGKCQEHFIEDDCSVAKTIAALRAIAEGRA